MEMRRVSIVTGAAVIVAVAGAIALGIAPGSAAAPPGGEAPTATPIKHLVVIYDENISFDHYFGTYPHAANPPGEPAFHPARRTPSVNGLTEALRIDNPNSANPQRLDRS